MYEPLIRSIKPNIPCSAGLAPVIIEDQATEDISGIEDRMGPRDPWPISRWVLGIMPLWASVLSMSKGTPSRPTITVRLCWLILSARSGNDSPGTGIVVADQDETPQLLDVGEAFDSYRPLGFDEDLSNFQVLYDFSVFLDNFER